MTPPQPTFRRGPFHSRFDRVLVREGVPVPRVDIIPTPQLSDHAALLLTLPATPSKPALNTTETGCRPLIRADLTQIKAAAHPIAQIHST